MKLIACPHCDLLCEMRGLEPGDAALCERCGSLLYQHKVRSTSRALGWAMAGLLLFIPANVYPILKLRALGLEQDATLFKGVLALMDNRLYAVAILTFLVSMLIPFMKLLLLTAVLWWSKRPSPRLARWFRYYHHIDSWGMLEIYLLGVLIALIKLGDIAEVVIGLGLYSFVGLLVASLGAQLTLDEHEIWEQLET
ncbi:MAG: paraquat-inducible protein A [Kiritimatiellia bacterium]|jgi:paraquat-inducible protein A